LSSFAVKERQTEEPLFEKWFNDQGYQVLRVKKGRYEGEGDSLFAGEKLFCGYGFRSTLDAYESIAEFFNLRKTIACKLVDARFYHLDTCFAPLNETKAIFYPEAFDKESIKLMESEIELIPVCKEDAEHFVCNTVVLGKDLVMPAKCTTTYQTLEQHGFKCHPVELGEFLKGGGSAKCLTLRLDRQ
jgi:N-dimethylarginine dimethylaminohydrolase